MQNERKCYNCMKILAISPTFNEVKNIKNHIDKIYSLNEELSILIIDDSSPDGTALVVKEQQKIHDNLFLIERPCKQGLGTAYVKGFEWAIQNSFDYIIQIDADMSHDASAIPNMIEKMNDYDFIVGSRYCNGINVVNWPLRRLFLSYFANTYARILTGVKIKDLTSGYNCFKTAIIKDIDYNKITSQGYAFQIELKYLVYRKKYSIIEHPIIFHDRTVGHSKMSKQIIFEAIFKVIYMKLKSILRII